MDEKYINQNAGFAQSEQPNTSFTAQASYQPQVSSPYYREQEYTPQPIHQPVQINKAQPQQENAFNPYSATTQYSPTDFQPKKPKSGKSKNAFLAVVAAGLELAELRRELAAPAHALALWTGQAASCHELSADDPACGAYLRGETIPTACSGWTLLRVDGLGLGWGKGSKGILKNHYPKGLRIAPRS